MNPEHFECERFECECSSFNHTLRIISDKEDGTVWVEVPLNSYLPWWRRIIVAFKYIFLIGSSEGYDSVALEHRDFDRIIGLLERAKEKRVG